MLPRIRVGLVVGAPRAAVGGGVALRLSTPDGTPVGRIAAGASASVTAENGAIRVQTAGFALAPMQVVVVTPEDSGHVRVEGREYRGALDLVVTDRGLVVANRVSVEDYLPGVVNAEMGRRAPEELAALAAQAVISRTVAVRAIGRAPARGYDLLATVADQAYLGIAAELPQGREAVESTRGLVLTHLGQPIDAFFHSTCGGNTAEPTEIFVGGGGRPYLTSVSDQAPDGRDYCAISPRHRWREDWTAGQITATLRETLQRPGLGALSGIEVGRRGATGRVMAITIRHRGGVERIEGANPVRQALRPTSGGMLRSSDFSVQLGRGGALVAEGRGAGHGVGMCQWGTVGRARAGASWGEILAAYFPGAELGRLY
jgi:stage II sporulation protein D